jgi:hypothetical protein
MQKVVFVACAAAGLVAGCGSTSPTSFCNSFEVEVCAREFECQPATVQMSSDFLATYGATQAECETKLKSNNCASVTNDKPCADATQTYHSSKADACVSDLKAASCATITSGNFTSGNCDTVCS